VRTRKLSETFTPMKLIARSVVLSAARRPWLWLVVGIGPALLVPMMVELAQSGQQLYWYEAFSAPCSVRSGAQLVRSVQVASSADYYLEFDFEQELSAKTLRALAASKVPPPLVRWRVMQAATLVASGETDEQFEWSKDHSEYLGTFPLETSRTYTVSFDIVRGAPGLESSSPRLRLVRRPEAYKDFYVQGALAAHAALRAALVALACLAMAIWFGWLRRYLDRVAFKKKRA
jgi:hypothetical protein